MHTDRFGGQHQSDSADAIVAFERAILEVAAHRPNGGAAIQEALAADPDLVGAHALAGFGALILGRSEMRAPAQAALDRARETLGRRGGSAGERLLVAALAQAVAGRFRAAALVLDERLVDTPGDLLALKLGQALRFMAGDLPGMLAATTRVLPHWSDGRPGAGYVMGCHAFALEEHGLYREAEQHGLAAIALAPDDSWGLHAVAHIHEMEGRTTEGVIWLERARPVWTGCNNFRFHMAWHLALFHLEAGRPAAALALYDAEVRPAPTDDFRDVANASSLLWRLRQSGIDVGDRWAELAAIAGRRSQDTALVFASLHHLLSLVARGDRTGCRAVIAGLTGAASGEGDQADVAARVGLPLALIIAGIGTSGGPGLERLARDLPALGGSNAQRDVFMRTLADIAAGSGDAATAQRILDLRRIQRRDDRFAGSLQVRLGGVTPVRETEVA